MAGYTYTTLKQAIQDYTDNQETTFVNNIDSFIEAAEEQILKSIPLETFRKNATAVLNANSKYFPKPADWLFTYSFSINSQATVISTFSESILRAASSLEPEKTLFKDTLLCDIDRNGTVGSYDALLYAQYLAGDTTHAYYIENTLIPTLTTDPVTYAAYVDYQKKFLLNKDVNFVQDYWPDDGLTGEPVYYADFDVDNLLIAPTPDAAYSAEMHYYYRPESLTTVSSGKTWISENAGPALLYGCLAEAYTFIKGEPDMIQLYTQKSQQSLQNLGIFAQAEGIDFLRRTSA